MADLENKQANIPEKKSKKNVKKKSDKPSFFSRVKSFFRSIKSEIKKISWSPASSVRKNTIVVLIVLVACAAAIFVVDYVFNQGIVALGKLVK